MVASILWLLIWFYLFICSNWDGTQTLNIPGKYSTTVPRPALTQRSLQMLRLAEEQAQEARNKFGSKSTQQLLLGQTSEFNKSSSVL